MMTIFQLVAFIYKLTFLKIKLWEVNIKKNQQILIKYFGFDARVRLVTFR